MSAPRLNRILVVDDEPDILTVTRITLTVRGGFEVEACSSGARALEAAPMFAPDLILLDVMMPGMDGPTTLAALRGEPELARIPVVFLTAKAMPWEISRLVALGAADVITKPFEPADLPARVRAALGRQD